MNFRFDPAARVEFLQAVVHFETQQFGLGERFEREIYRCVKRICEAPLSYPAVYRSARRCLTDTFHYAVVFTICPDGSIVLVAISHQARRPGHWKSRLQ